MSKTFFLITAVSSISSPVNVLRPHIHVDGAEELHADVRIRGLRQVGPNQPLLQARDRGSERVRAWRRVRACHDVRHHRRRRERPVRAARNQTRHGTHRGGVGRVLSWHLDVLQCHRNALGVRAYYGVDPRGRRLTAAHQGGGQVQVDGDELDRHVHLGSGSA